mmetsp:Transcript_86/g.197  ORF Transcript_86/g.197 Transcript_86/m.197 type:complete len:381 (+) Transcript_86:660-1802(+)
MVRLNIPGRVSVDGSVGEVHRGFVEVVRGRRRVRRCCQPREALVKEVDLERVDAQHERVDAHVKLKAVDAQRVWHVRLCHVVGDVDVLDLFKRLDQVDAAALAAIGGLEDERRNAREALVEPALVAAQRSEELVELLGQVERGGVKGELGWQARRHARHVAREQALAADLEHRREVVEALERPQLGHALCADGEVAPAEVPVVILFVRLIVAELARHFPKDFILAGAKVDHQPTAPAAAAAAAAHAELRRAATPSASPLLCWMADTATPGAFCVRGQRDAAALPAARTRKPVATAPPMRSRGVGSPLCCSSGGCGRAMRAGRATPRRRRHQIPPSTMHTRGGAPRTRQEETFGSSFEHHPMRSAEMWACLHAFTRFEARF